METRKAKRVIDRRPQYRSKPIDKSDEKEAKKCLDYAKKEDEFLNLIAEIIVNLIMEEE